MSAQAFARGAEGVNQGTSLELVGRALPAGARRILYADHDELRAGRVTAKALDPWKSGASGRDRRRPLPHADDGPERPR